jgi:hypothetical protein
VGPADQVTFSKRGLYIGSEKYFLALLEVLKT